MYDQSVYGSVRPEEQASYVIWTTFHSTTRTYPGIPVLLAYSEIDKLPAIKMSIAMANPNDTAASAYV